MGRSRVYSTDETSENPHHVPETNLHEQCDSPGNFKEENHG